MTPFEAVYGRPPPPRPCYSEVNSGLPAVDRVLLDRSQLLQQLRMNLVRAQNRMRIQADNHRREVEFSVDDWVLVRLQPYRQQSLVRRPFQKLCKRFFGPYKIVERIGVVAYKLDLPESCRIHPVFHVSLLKLWKGPLPSEVTPLPDKSIDDHPIFRPELILDKRIVVDKGQKVKQVLVKWHTTPAEESSWENLVDIATLFPTLHLEDKVPFEGVGDDTNMTGAMAPIQLHATTETAPMQKDAGEGVLDAPAEDHGTRRTRERREPHWLWDYAR